MAQKNIKVSFPIPVSEKGRIKANDAKKLLKHLAVSNLLKVGTDYFVTDSTGHEEMWSFQKSMDWEHDYEFSCEVFDDDRDFYNCLYFDKKSGKIDYKSCEYEAHLVECAKKKEKMNEYTELANRFADWYEAQINANEDGLSDEGHEAERIIRKYLGKSMDQMRTDECIDALPVEGKIEIHDFLNNEEMNESVDANGDEYTTDDVFNFLNEAYDVTPEWRIEGLMHEFGMTRDEAAEWLTKWDKEINKSEEGMNESVEDMYKDWVEESAPNYDVSNYDAYEAGAKLAEMPEEDISNSYENWLEQHRPDYDVSNYDAFEAGYNFEGYDADTYEKYVRLCQHDEMEPYSEEEWRRMTGITKEMEESVTLEVYDADGKMIDRQSGFANSAEARDFAEWNEDQYPEVHRVVIKYNEAVEEGSDDEFVLNTLEGDLKMLGFHLVNQGTTLAYPEYFGEGRDGYMFAERNCNPFLWAVVDVSARPKFCVDIMETDDELQQTEDLDNRCDLSYEEMLDYIKSFTEEETYEEKLTSRLNLINNKLAEAEEGFEEEKLYTGCSVEDIANQLEEEGYVVDTIFGKWLMFSDEDHNKYEAEVTKYYGGEYELSSANIALVPAEEEMDAEYDFDEVDEAENEEGWNEEYKWDGFEDKDFGMRDEWLADAPELEIPEEEIDDVDLRARNEVEAEMYDEKIQEAAALREAVTFKAHHEEFLKKIRG